MQTQNVKYTNKDGILIIAQGTERIEEGTFCEVDFKEMYVPASVKTLEYPLDLCEELEADLYLYGADTSIAFSEEAMWRVVKARIYVMPELQADYEERFDRTLQGNWRELISIEAMPADKMSHYGPVEQPQCTSLTPSEAAKFEAIEHERQLLEEQWNTQCAQPYAVALSELQAEEEVFKNSIRIVKRKVWQFPFFSKPNPRGVTILMPSGNELNNHIAEIVLSQSKNAELIEGVICKITTQEVDKIVLDFNSKFREYYKDNFNEAYYELGRYLDEMDKQRNGYFSRHLVTNNKMRDILDFTLKLSDDRFAEFANKINGQDILIIDDTISRGQSIKEACQIMMDSYAPKSITVLTLLSKLY